MKATLSIYLLLVLTSFVPYIKLVEKKEIVIAAASDLKFAMDSIVSVFRKENPAVIVKVSYGSSGNFFEQISNGAPFDLFFSADIDYVKKLKEKNIAITEAKVYGTGQIVLWSKLVDPNINKINSLLNSSISKIAIANPEHAPYGKRAVESLIYYKIYDKVKIKLVLGENVSQTAQYITSGAAEIGIVALSLALSTNMQKEGGKYWLIPAESHRPLEQGYVILQHAKDNRNVLNFAVFISSPKGKSILKQFGFN